MGSIMPPLSTNVALTQKTNYCGNMIYENGQLSKILTDVGYKRKSKFFVLLNINKNFCYVRVSKQK